MRRGLPPTGRGGGRESAAMTTTLTPISVHFAEGSISGTSAIGTGATRGDIMANPYKLPSYRHVNVEGRNVRAYLVLAADVHGLWGASYHAWMGENSDDVTGKYVVIAPVVIGAPNIRSATRRLSGLLKDFTD